MGKIFICAKDVYVRKEKEIVFMEGTVYTEDEVKGRLSDYPADAANYFVDVTDGFTFEKAVYYGLLSGEIGFHFDGEPGFSPCAVYEINGTEWQMDSPEKLMDESANKEQTAKEIAADIKGKMGEDTFIMASIAYLSEMLPFEFEDAFSDAVEEYTGVFPRNIKYMDIEDFKTLKPGHILQVDGMKGEFTVTGDPFYNADADPDNKGWEVETNNGTISIENDIRIAGFEYLDRDFIMGDSRDIEDFSREEV